MIREAIKKLSEKKDLLANEMKSSFYEIMNGEANHEDMKAFLISLAEKGETIDEITAAATVMREKMTKIKLPYDTILDTCGTGGGGTNSFNVSTAVAIVSTGAGAKVAKHGNRSFTSHCGSADILEKLGAKIDLTPDRVAECIKEVGIGFLFAPLYHSAMKHVVGVRKEIKWRTIFNLIGPLSNPAGANVQLLGIYRESLAEPLAYVLNNLGAKRAFVVYGLDGFDEVSISDESIVAEVKDRKVRAYKVRPEDFGIECAKKSDVACKDLDDNVNIFTSILNGKKGPARDMVLVNASLAVVAAGRARDFREGVKVAADSIDSGKAKNTLESLRRFTNS